MAARGSLRDGGIRKTTNRRVDPEIRFACVSFGEEEIKRVCLSLLNTKLRRASIHINGGVLRAMDPAEVDGKVTIDERKQIVVARKCKYLAALVKELGTQL